MSKDQSKKLGLVIVGGGRGGLAFLRLFAQEQGIEILGIADIHPEAAAIKYAQSLNIPTTTDFRELIKQDGVELIVDVSGNPNAGAEILKEKRPEVELLGGITSRLMWNFIDLLERKVVERTQEVKELQEKVLRNKLAILQELSSGVSHKLRNPLGAIKNSTQYLLNKMNGDPKVKKQIEAIDREIQVAEKAIDDLVNLVKPVDMEMTVTPDDLQRQLIQSEKLAGIGIMAAGIAHEVNNPLSIILGKAEMILEEDDPDSIKKYAEGIIKHSKIASEIVKGITFYSRAAWGPGAQGQKINLNNQLKEAIKISKLSPLFDNVEVLTDYQDLPPINGNIGEIQQVFTNLMMNASHAMNGDGRLYVKSRYEEGYIIVTIKDTGAGIKKDHLDKLFTPFFTTKDPGKGTGLGLNIVHKIITNHAGSISVESEEGKGATFMIRLPKAQESPKLEKRG